MDALKRINYPIFSAVAQEPDVRLRDALCLYFGLLELIDQIESAPGLPLAVRMELFEFLFMYLAEAGEKDLVATEHCPLLGDLAGQYQIVETRYRRVIEETLVEVMSGLKDTLASPGPARNLPACLQYCHYAAGLPGLGLLRLLCEAGVEPPGLWYGRQAEMLALGTFLQLTENITLLPRELSILPADLDYAAARSACNSLANEALLLVKRIRSHTGQRLIVVPFLAALASFHTSCTLNVKSNPVDDGCKTEIYSEDGLP